MGLSFSSYSSYWPWPASTCVPRLYTSESPKSLYISAKSGIHKVEQVSLKSFLESRCPSLFSEFRPVWWLNSGHLQTGYCVVGDFSKVDEIVYDRELIRLMDGGTIGLDFTPPTAERVIGDDVPIVVVMHGLTGGSHESYVRSILTQAVSPEDAGGLGYRGVVVNFRGCAGVPLTSAQFYSAGHTDDLRQALMCISKRYPDAPLLGVGFSLGANVIVRYLGEEGDRSLLRTGCALGCPWDLVENSNRLERSWIHRQIYSKGMGGNLVNLAKRHLVSISELSDNRLALLMPDLLALKSPTLLDVDSKLICIVGGSSPPFPFPTPGEYHAWASSHKCLKDVRVPLLAINAEDDPIVRTLPLDVGDNGLVALVATAGGGHLGWFEAGGVHGSVKRWISRPVLEWLRASAEDLVVDPPFRLDLEDVNGWTREVGRNHLGFKESGEVVQIEGAQGEGGLLAGL